MDYDVIVIGAGPGGYVAAIRAAQLGLKVAVVEEDRLGGVCLNRGCIPTKALLASCRVLNQARRAGEFGILSDSISFDWEKIQARKNRVVSGLVEGIEKLFKHHRISLYQGRGKLTGKTEVVINGNQPITAGDIILATGSRSPRDIPGFGIDGERVYTSDEALELDRIPRSITIVGAGAVGCEFATIFNSLGSQVLIVEMLPQVLPTEDSQIGRYLASYLKKRGIRIKTGVRIERIEKGDDGVFCFLDDGTAEKSKQVLVSVGRRLNTEGLGLEELGIEMDGPAVKVNDRMQTSVGNIYAIGDVTGKKMLAHLASAQGKVAAQNIAGGNGTIDYRAVPGCIFTTPEVATVGLKEEDAKAQGIKVEVGRFPFAANGKAVAEGEAEGFVKIVADGPTGRVLGVHILGPHASDLIAQGVLAVQSGLTADELEGSIQAHPTLGEALAEAAGDVLHRAIHIV